MYKLCDNMQYFENQYIKRMDSNSIQPCLTESLSLCNCIIGVLDFNALKFVNKVVIKNCVINELIIYCTWFDGGLTFVNNIVSSDINYEMGGHNNNEIIFLGNVFNGFFGFFDCHFNECIILKNNIFVKNSDLLVKENNGFDNIFLKGVVLENNIGRLDVFKNG